ncbi:MAG: type VI secretion system contractile sheath large subunit, partial [Phycisphaerales bacterium]
MAEANPQTQAAAGEQVAEISEFEKLLSKEFKPKTDDAKSAITTAVQTLAQQALAGTSIIPGESIKTIEAIIAAIDKKLTEQINAIMHQADFQKLESAWR